MTTYYTIQQQASFWTSIEMTLRRPPGIWFFMTNCLRNGVRHRRRNGGPVEAANGDHIEADFPNIQAVSICLLELQSCARHIGGSIRNFFISNLKIWSYPSVFVKQVFGQGHVLVMKTRFQKYKARFSPQNCLCPFRLHNPKPMHVLRVLNSSLIQHMLTAFKISAVGKIVVGGL